MAQETLLELYFPKTLEELKLPTRIHNLIKENKERQGFRLLLNGTPGTGKSSTSKLISKGHDVLMLSGSNDFNVETMRQKVYPFISSHSVLKKQKTLIIEECENIRDAIQDSFKIVLDQSPKINYIFITNEVASVNGAIKSRCTNIEYDFQASELPEQKKNYIAFILDVCQKQNIPYDLDGARELFKLNFPDFRHVLVVLQQIIDAKQTVNVETIKLISESGAQNIELYEIIQTLNDAQKFYEKLTEYKSKEREALISLGEPFLNYLNSKGKFELSLKAGIIVADYSFRFTTTINKFITFYACCSELKALFK